MLQSPKDRETLFYLTCERIPRQETDKNTMLMPSGYVSRTL
ncbi:hypothetical protein HV081_18440 [Enterobacter roggenkampii]|nr:hypothetical protein HV081_18440 [Enterobacter roggenkampii]